MVSTRNAQKLIAEIVRDGAMCEALAVALEAQHDLIAETRAITVYTRTHGLSRADRICLAFARHLDLPEVRAGRDLAKVAEPVAVRVGAIRYQRCVV